MIKLGPVPARLNTCSAKKKKNFFFLSKVRLRESLCGDGIVQGEKKKKG